MALDDATRRQLRFSLFLQGFAALMMAIAFVVRATAIGWDLLTMVFALAFAGIVGAIVFTRRQLR